MGTSGKTSPYAVGAGSDYVFHDPGRSIGDFERSWRTALVAAGLPDRHFDVQNMIHDRVPEVVTISISGHQDALNGEDQRKDDAHRLRLERGEFAESKGGYGSTMTRNPSLFLVRPRGIEPLAFGFVVRRSIHLS